MESIPENAGERLIDGLRNHRIHATESAHLLAEELDRIWKEDPDPDHFMIL